MNDNKDKSEKSNEKISESRSGIKSIEELIQRIVEVQSLPENVVIEFLEAQGSLRVDNVKKEN